ncbi:MAG TPA: 1-acyl-sn-glycerol-3-phosphate acyltransferase [Saprospiraceae bacterium]|nr:1-acyl-sn-glycerol-3-phosphate acyltransferase [Saprospiraceae bacterium]
MVSAVSKKILDWLGFNITGNINDPHKKKLYVVVPHTSNWDFPLGILVKWGYKLKAGFIAKNSLFKPPFGWLFRALGGIPVDRSRKSDTVKNIAEVFRNTKELRIAIAPEGTRKKVDQLKKGFYYIAKEAGIPILLVKFDFENKVVHFSEPFFPGTEEAEDWNFLNNYWNGVHGKIPENSFGYGKTPKITEGSL